MKRQLTAFLLLVLLITVRAHADTAGDALAKTHFEHGQQLSEDHQYLEALAEFSAGYELSGKPLFLFNMGECARLAGDAARARRNYERYLAEAPSGKLAVTARQRLVELGAPPVAAKKPAVVAMPVTPVVVPVTVAATRTDLVTAPDAGPKKPIWKRTGFIVGMSVGAAVIVTAIGVGAWAGTRGNGCTGTCADLR